MDDPVLLLTRVAPVLGTFTAIGLYFSPLMAARRAVKIKSLGELNVEPYPLIAANCCGWVAYSIYCRDAYIFCANAPGVLLGLYMMLLTLPLANAKTTNRVMATVLFFAAVIEVVGYLGAAESLSPVQLKLLWGVVANGILLVFYSSPLSSLLQVFQTRTNHSLHLPMAVMTVINGTLWVAYGLAVKDAFVWAPNAVGVVLGLVQLLLYVIFRQLKQSDIEAPLLPPERSNDS